MRQINLSIKNLDIASEARALEDNKALEILNLKDWVFDTYNDRDGYISIELRKGSRVKLSSVEKLLPAYSVSRR